tara:strand:+ start:556 stop:822 length:267 start_codon:yes stop_codon:yes gene_type:complete
MPRKKLWVALVTSNRYGEYGAVAGSKGAAFANARAVGGNPDWRDDEAIFEVRASQLPRGARAGSYVFYAYDGQDSVVSRARAASAARQ